MLVAVIAFSLFGSFFFLIGLWAAAGIHNPKNR
jgi:hypothetical protein